MGTYEIMRDFLNLPEEDRQKLVELHNHQRYVVEQRERYENEIKRLHTALFNLQTTGCEHPFATRVNKSDTGNWCKADDRYWVECACPDCGKRWAEDQ